VTFRGREERQSFFSFLIGVITFDSHAGPHAG
jgi:hypothetical protein